MHRRDRFKLKTWLKCKDRYPGKSRFQDRQSLLIATLIGRIEPIFPQTLVYNKVSGYMYLTCPFSHSVAEEVAASEQ